MDTRYWALLLLPLSFGATPGYSQCSVETPRLFAGDPTDGAQFGHHVAVSSGVAVVGVPLDSEKGNAAGAAYVFTRAGTVWSQQVKLFGDETAAHDRFGQSVAVFGDTILVGAFHDDDNGPNSGSVFVFVRDGATWSQEAKLLAADGDISDEFGRAVSLFNDTAIVGAYQDSNNEISEGSAYVFVRNGTTWNQQAKLLPSDPGAFHHFGASVSVFGDRALIGADEHSGNGVDSGAAYVFLRTGTAWEEEAQLIGSDTAAGDFFGCSVSLSGNGALIGAPFDDDVCPSNPSCNSGTAYVFDYSGSGWNETTKLMASDAAFVDTFGRSVSLREDVAVVGAPLDDDSGPDSGSAYVFTRTASTWNEEAKLLCRDGNPSDQFGRTVSVADENILVSAHLSDEGGPGAGSASAYQWIADPPMTYCTPKTNSCGGVPTISASGKPSASASSGFLLLGSKARANRPGLLLYTNQGRAAFPFDGGLLCIAPPLRRTSPDPSSRGSTGCTGKFSIDMNAFASGNNGGTPASFLGVPGAVVNCQWWGRDTVLHGSYLSDALEYIVCD